MKLSFRWIKNIVASLVLCSAVIKGNCTDTLTVSSPNGKLLFRIHKEADAKLSYTINYGGKTVILNSSLGVEGWRDGLSLKKVERKQHDETWRPLYGERWVVRDYYREADFILAGKEQGSQMKLQVRAYNAGIAFRYFFPTAAKKEDKISIGKDFTSYSLPADTKAWFTDQAQGNYRLMPLQNWPDQAERPLTLQLENGLYAALAEAEVVDYCRTKFSLDSTRPNTITSMMYDRVNLTTPFATPWKVIMVAEKATALLQNNDMILNLNAACALKDTKWIKPGKVMREMTLSTDGAKELVDFAVKRHLQYIHFDAGWYGYEYDSASDASKVNVDPRRNPKNDLDLKQVIQYARQKGVGVFLYVNQLALAKQLDKLLPLYQQWGVAGIKFGFVTVGSYQWTSWLHEAVKKCAQYHLMVDIHDEYRPTGFSRTYPNLLTQEGVRGNEEMPDANNNTVLPFTRFLCGPADYTICYYHRPELKQRLRETQNARVLKTTSMHQMALSVVYYSPLQFMYWYDKPEDSKDEPELEFFDHVPTVWDDTKVMDGEPGQFITIARRSGNEWFLGAVTDNDARDVRINFSFLPPGKKYTATLYYDDPNSPRRTRVSMKHLIVDRGTVLHEHLLASGGEAIWIRPQ
jgi:alpha-glucosidase